MLTRIFCQLIVAYIVIRIFNGEMDDARLRSFLSVARLGGFSAAARQLNVTQPAVSHHIRSLEEQYRVQLFRRHANRSVLTLEGEILRKHAEELESAYRRLDHEMGNLAAAERTFDVGATLTVAEYVLPSILAAHRREHTSVRIRLSVRNTDETLERLMHGHLELAIVEGPTARLTLPSRKLVDDELFVVAAPEHRLTRESRTAPISLDSLLESDLILREPGSGTRAVLEHYLLLYNNRGLTAFTPFMEIGSINTIKSLVRSGLGVTVISALAVRKELEEGSLERIALAGRPIKRELRVVWNEYSSREFVEEFRAFCRRHLSTA